MTTTGKVLLGLLGVGVLVGAGIFIYKGINSPATPAPAAGATGGDASTPSAPASLLSVAEKQLWGNSYAKAKGDFKSSQTYKNLADTKKLNVNTIIDALGNDEQAKRQIIDNSGSSNTPLVQAITNYLLDKTGIGLLRR